MLPTHLPLHSFVSASIADKVDRFTLARIKLQKELAVKHEFIHATNDRKNRNVEIKKWRQCCEESLEEANSRNKKDILLTHQKSDKATFKNWLKLLTFKNYEFLNKTLQ